MSCDDLEGQNWGEEAQGEGIYVYIYPKLIYFDVQRKLTQHYKASIHQLKKKFNKEGMGILRQHHWDAYSDQKDHKEVRGVKEFGELFTQNTGWGFRSFFQHNQGHEGILAELDFRDHLSPII